MLEPGDDRRIAVITCHGMLSSMVSIKHRELSALLVEAGFWTLRFDFSSRGKSRRLNPDFDSSRITYTDQLEDLSGAVAYLRETVRPTQLHVVGSSMGGSVALLHAAEDPRTNAIVTYGSPVHPAQPRPPHFSEAVLAQWQTRGYITVAGNRIDKAYLEDARSHDFPAAAAKIRCPILICHGTADDVVPYSAAETLAAVTDPRGELFPIEGADHRFSSPEARELLLSTTLRFLERCSNLPPSPRG